MTNLSQTTVVESKTNSHWLVTMNKKKGQQKGQLLIDWFVLFPLKIYQEPLASNLLGLESVLDTFLPYSTELIDLL